MCFFLHTCFCSCAASYDAIKERKEKNTVSLKENCFVFSYSDKGEHNRQYIYSVFLFTVISAFFDSIVRV